MELDKLALYRGSAPVTVDDVRALVAEAIPGSVWAFVDAVGERSGQAARRSSTGCSTTTAGAGPPGRPPSAVRELLELGDRLAPARTLAGRGQGDGHQQRVPGPTLAARPRLDDATSSTDALDGLVELDAMVKGAPGPRRTRRSDGWRSRCG